MPTTRSSKDDAARLTNIAAVLNRLQAMLKLYDDDAEIYVSFDSSTMSITDTTVTDAEKEQARKNLLTDVHTLEKLLTNGGVPPMTFDSDDLELIINFVLALAYMRPSSKKALSRLFTAMLGDVAGTLTTTLIPSTPRTTQKINMVFDVEGRLPVVGKAKSRA